LPAPPRRRRATCATLVGAIAILLWASLALLATGTGDVPPFQLVAMSFAIAAVLALAKWVLRGESIVAHLRQPAATWAGYSTASRRFARVPTDAVGGLCAATAVLALLCHLAWETTRWPDGAQWLAVIALGIGPVGLAFFVWDYGVKHGSLRTLGGLSYATPLLSTILLIVFGRAAASATIAAAALLIVGGAVLAARDLWSKPS
jgi:drug/metabolite transporter (DMT)-like permease